MKSVDRLKKNMAEGENRELTSNPFKQLPQLQGIVSHYFVLLDVS